MSVKGKTVATRNWQDFKTVNLGIIEVARAGKHTLTVRPTKMPGFAVMNLRTVHLTPIR